MNGPVAQRRTGTRHPHHRHPPAARFGTDLQQRREKIVLPNGGDAAVIGDLLAPVGGIPTVTGFDVTLAMPLALMARTT